MHVPEPVPQIGGYPVKEDQVHREFVVLQEAGHGIGGHPEGLRLGIAVDAAGDEGKGHGLAALLHRQLQGTAVAGAEQMLLPELAPVPDGSNRVDHVPGGQAVALRELRLPGLTAAQGPALGQKLRPRGPVDGPVHAPAPKKRGIGRVDDGVHGHPGDIVAHQ